MQKILIALMRSLIRGCAGAAAALVLLSSASFAQDAPPARSPLGVPMPHAAGPASTAQQPQSRPSPQAPVSRGVVDRMWSWLLATQASLNRDMATAVRKLKSGDPLSGALTLIGIAFAYGVLHAAGPGHGKAVISSYVLANNETVRRGIALSFLAALFQALSAILFVGILAIVLRQTSLQMRGTEATIETISWGLVAIVGAYLLWRQVKPLIAGASASDAGGHVAHAHADPHHAHAHHHPDHGPGCSCGHSHMPAPKDLQGDWSWKRALPLAMTVGIRPCTGAILLLIFALSQGMLWAGILGTFAMAFGTAITVSVLAALAVSSRDWAAKASGPASLWADRIQTAAALGGAALVFGLGSAFFVASLSGNVSPL